MNENESQQDAKPTAPEVTIQPQPAATVTGDAQLGIGDKVPPEAYAKTQVGVDLAAPGAEKTAVVVVDEKGKVEELETFLVARTQTEMQDAQEQLQKWAAKVLARKRQELDDAKKNLAHAIKGKYKTETYKRLVESAEKKVTFFEKVKAALDAGYAIVPDMGVEVFAVRTTRKTATQNYKTSERSWGVQVKDQTSNLPPVGQGRYVTPEAKQVRDTVVVEHKAGHEPKYEYSGWAEGHDEFIDFPFKKARPIVLETATEAMKKKVFDEIGALPRFRMQPDPVIVGRICYRDGSKTLRLNFLITWFLDTTTMEL